jgi:hypothetical protein
LTSLTEHERSMLAFGKTMPIAQEGSVPGSTLDHLAFTDIVPLAQDGTITAGMLKAANYRDSGGKATFTNNKFKVKPSISDFVIDVQNVARKALTAEEFTYFKRTYFNEFLGIAEMNESGEIAGPDRTPDGRDKFFSAFLLRFKPEDRETVAAFDRNIRMKVGAALIATGVHPYRTYMNQGDLDVRKRFEK